MKIEAAIEQLRSAVETGLGLSDDFVAQVRASHDAATHDDDEAVANRWWCIRSFLEAYCHYVSAFGLMKAEEWYRGWCELEKAEIRLHHLYPHEKLIAFALPSKNLSSVIRNFQRLFPYRVFMSPGFLIRRRECGICGQTMTPFGGCGHVVGHLYGGRLCYSIIKDAEFLETSFVYKPAQKYSVAFLGGGDHYDYSLVRHVIERLPAPFAGFDLTVTKRGYPLDRFKDLSPEDRCPCWSGEPFGVCCQAKGLVELDHFDITFHFPVDRVDDELLGTTQRDDTE